MPDECPNWEVGPYVKTYVGFIMVVEKNKSDYSQCVYYNASLEQVIR